jgi:hypothetical protein
MITYYKEKYKLYLKRKSNEYISLSFKSSSKISTFVSKLKVLNNQTGELFPVKYDFMKIQKDNYLWFNFVSTYMQNLAQKDSKRAVFVTLTLPSEYHKYKTLKNGSHILNDKYSKDINSGYKKLNESFRHLYNNFMINRKKVKTMYLKVIEPHKDFTPHLHAVIFIDDSQIDKFKNHFENTIKLFELGVQYDFTVLDSVQASVSYIMKYVKKSMFDDKESTVRVIDGWKKQNKIRMFTHSQIEVKRYFFKIISRYVDLASDLSGYSILENLENKISLDLKYYDDSGLYKSKVLFNSSSDIKVYIRKKKNNRKDLSKYIEISDLYHHWTNIEDFLLELKKFDFDLIDLVRYYYEFYSDSPELYYLSSDYDYNHFFRSLEFNFFKDMFENYVFEYIEEFKTSYKITDFVIYDNGIKLYDLNDYELY